ncbi:DUF4143 domain-containing protein [Floccifex sp.]|uniref:DUF4143 domain-containing protein n=1 Tax=Floccifex sp. TaxID=2815810 RepID=UPI003F0FDA6A
MKYFYENALQYHIICVSSLLGKVQFLQLYPLSFEEFLYATNKKQYYFVGGMPKVVKNFAENKDFNEVREIQHQILKAYEDLKAFKLFMVNIGLLSCKVGLHQQTLLDGHALFVEFKGALSEQYVCQQLKTIENIDTYYYTNNRGSCEINFVIDTGQQIIPVEVKAEVNLKAKSL